FVSSPIIYPGDLGSVEQADQMCTSLANANGHPGSYVAWLSSASSNFITRLGVGNRGWVRADGLPVIDTLDDLLGASFLYALTLDEGGRRISAVVVTGSDRYGHYEVAGGLTDCQGYTSRLDPLVSCGQSAATDGNFAEGTNCTCATEVHLLC